MRIGIDAKWYFNGNISGRVVIVNLLEAIAKNPGNHEYTIILKAEDKNRPFPFKDHPKFNIVYIKTFTNQLTNLFSPLFLRKYKLDVCIYQYFTPLFSSFRRVVYIHDIIFESNPEYFTRKEQVYFKLMKLMARRAHGIVTVSKTEKNRLQKYGYIGKRTKLTYIHNGIKDEFHHLPELIDSDVKRVRSRYNLPERFLLYLGRINQRKNIPALINAFAKLDSKDLVLVIAGERHWSKTNISQVIKDAQVEDRVKFTGFIQDEDISTLYRMACAFCFMSFDEGFGLPIAEAMACGVPVVVSNTDIHKEICGEAAIYANPQNIEDIADALHSALNCSELVLDKVKCGKRITKGYAWSKATEKLLKFVEQV